MTRKSKVTPDAGETGPISNCPKCEKKVIKVRNYTNGDKLFVHEEIVREIPFPHIEIVNCCYVKAGEQTK